eukprot:498885_1
MKELCFKHLNVNQMFDVLSNWRMVQQLELIGKETEMYVDVSRSSFFFISLLYGGSMCGFLEETYIKTGQCLSQSELKLVLQNGVMETLKTLHDHGYIHGDIKPENLVYELNDNNTTGIQDIVTSVIDYDLCVRFDANAPHCGVLSEYRGTLGYSAPEWSPYTGARSAITPKVDIYSLGLTMLILLCGEQPFLCPSAMRKQLEKERPNINIKEFVYETMIQHGESMIAYFLKQLAPQISTDLHDLLQSMLVLDPLQRIDVNDVI